MIIKKGLLKILSQYGLHETPIDRFSNFLNNRTQIVLINSTLSDPLAIYSGAVACLDYFQWGCTFFVIVTCHLGTHFLGTHCRLGTHFSLYSIFFFFFEVKNQIYKLVVQKCYILKQIILQ